MKIEMLTTMSAVGVSAPMIGIVHRLRKRAEATPLGIGCSAIDRSGAAKRHAISVRFAGSRGTPDRRAIRRSFVTWPVSGLRALAQLGRRHRPIGSIHARARVGRSLHRPQVRPANQPGRTPACGRDHLHRPGHRGRQRVPPGQPLPADQCGRAFQCGQPRRCRRAADQPGDPAAGAVRGDRCRVAHLPAARAQRDRPEPRWSPTSSPRSGSSTFPASLWSSSTATAMSSTRASATRLRRAVRPRTPPPRPASSASNRTSPAASVRWAMLSPSHPPPRASSRERSSRRARASPRSARRELRGWRCSPEACPHSTSPSRSSTCRLVLTHRLAWSCTAHRCRRSSRASAPWSATRPCFSAPHPGPR